MMTILVPIDVQMAHGHMAEDEEEEASPMLVMPEELSCPICFKLMTDPVVAEDGQTYQRQAIEEWINKCTTGTVPEHRGGIETFSETALRVVGHYYTMYLRLLSSCFTV
jgi:hypothetical protein